MKNSRIGIGLGSCALVAATLLAVYGVGVSWRQVITCAVVVSLVWFANECRKEAFPAYKHQRIQFSVAFTNIRQALIDSGVFDEAQAKENEAAISSLGTPCICWTWLEEDLFYVQTGPRGYFTSKPELYIDLDLPPVQKPLPWDRPAFPTAYISALALKPTTFF